MLFNIFILLSLQFYWNKSLILNTSLVFPPCLFKLVRGIGIEFLLF